MEPIEPAVEWSERPDLNRRPFVPQTEGMDLLRATVHYLRACFLSYGEG